MGSSAEAAPAGVGVSRVVAPLVKAAVLRRAAAVVRALLAVVLPRAEAALLVAVPAAEEQAAEEQAAEEQAAEEQAAEEQAAEEQVAALVAERAAQLAAARQAVAASSERASLPRRSRCRCRTPATPRATRWATSSTTPSRRSSKRPIPKRRSRRSRTRHRRGDGAAERAPRTAEHGLRDVDRTDRGADARVPGSVPFSANVARSAVAGYGVRAETTMTTSARWQRRFLGFAALITGACGISGKDDYHFGSEQGAGAGNGAGGASGGIGTTASGGAATGGAVAMAGSTDAGTGQTPELGETAGSGGQSGPDSGGAGPDSGGAGPDSGGAGPDSGGAGPDSGGAGMNEGGTSGVTGEGGLGGEAGAAFECTPSTRQCVGNGVQSCSERGVWGDAVACPPSARVCADAGLCVPPSCEGLPATCGPAGDDSCCSSPVIPAGTFNRGNDASYTATLNDFRLDAYEITVGRFRKFVATYSQNMTTSGAGKNPNNPSDAGWNGTLRFPRIRKPW